MLTAAPISAQMVSCVNPASPTPISFPAMKSRGVTELRITSMMRVPFSSMMLLEMVTPQERSAM